MSTPVVPAIPPRPSKASKAEDAHLALPQIPSRPVKKQVDRSISPNPERFAQSPLTEGFPGRNQKSDRPVSGHSYRGSSRDPIERSRSVDMPSLGEEGMEYGAIPDEPKDQSPPTTEQTRSVTHDLKLHAPKPSLPAESAKERVREVTRTDSEKAASFGIGRPSMSEDRPASRPGMRREPSYAPSIGSEGNYTDDEHGIPEIGQRVPMNRHLGDVQAPSQDLTTESPKRHHQRKRSARNLPPGSYGLHGHGVDPQDQLEKAYYDKHPELRVKERHHPVHERQNDFAMSSSDLNKLVKSGSNRPISSHYRDLDGTPTEDIAFQASEEYTHRMSSPRPSSSKRQNKLHSKAISPDDAKAGDDDDDDDDDDDRKPIHVNDSRHPEYYSYGDEDATVDGAEPEYQAPILASDEIEFGPNAKAQHPAIHPHHDRSDSFERNDAPVRPVVRPPVIHRPISEPHFSSTPLDDVEEYEPLFPEEVRKEQAKQRAAEENRLRRHFPSKDIWEDAPNSVHYTVEVSTPDVDDETSRRKSSSYFEGRPITPAQAFAQYQEELAEREAKSRSNNFLPLSEDKPQKPTWVGHQTHLGFAKPASSHRFPSRDVWEDVPESQLYEATLSESPEKPEVPQRPSKKQSEPAPPSIPDRPKPRRLSGDDTVKQAPPITDKPKPQIPARPAKFSPVDAKTGDAIAAKPKPPVPSRPVGGKIAALQAGFMSDLNKRLQLGPQALKKEEPQEEQAPTEEKEKAPLSDARKGRARGPQRRAPARAATPAADASQPSVVLGFTQPLSLWSIDPEDGDFNVYGEPEAGLEAEPTAAFDAAASDAAASPGPAGTSEPAADELAADELAADEPAAAELSSADAADKTVPVAAAKEATDESAEPIKKSEIDETVAAEVGHEEESTAAAEEGKEQAVETEKEQASDIVAVAKPEAEEGEEPAIPVTQVSSSETTEKEPAELAAVDAKDE